MAEVIQQKLQDLNLKALLLSEEARGMATLFDKLAYHHDVGCGAIAFNSDEERGMLCLVRGMARYFETEFEKIAQEVDEANMDSKPNEYPNGQEKKVTHGEINDDV
jgi:hypothetical protein